MTLSLYGASSQPEPSVRDTPQQQRQAPPDAIVVQVHNVTARDVRVRLGDEDPVTINGQMSRVLTTIPKAADGGASTKGVAVTAASTDGAMVRLNSIILNATQDSAFDLIWGGLGVKDEVNEAPSKQPKDGDELDDLLRERDQITKGWHPGLPFRFADTLLGQTRKGKKIAGEVLSAKSAHAWYVGNAYGMLLVRIPKGSFVIAQTGGAAGRNVTLSRDYFMGVSEVTRAQMKYASEATLPRPEDQERPVAMVTWSEAAEWCAKLSDVKAFAYNLPTEAQWEYACQSGQLRPFSPPGVDQTKIMWFAKNSGMTVRPVAQLLPNAFGIFDMHGNVREWCRDWWHPVPSVGIDPIGPKSGQERVRRGGAYDTPSSMCTCGYRDSGPPDLPQPWIGFRVVLEQTPGGG